MAQTVVSAENVPVPPEPWVVRHDDSMNVYYYYRESSAERVDASAHVMKVVSAGHAPSDAAYYDDDGTLRPPVIVTPPPTKRKVTIPSTTEVVDAVVRDLCEGNGREPVVTVSLDGDTHTPNNITRFRRHNDSFSVLHSHDRAPLSQSVSLSPSGGKYVCGHTDEDSKQCVEGHCNSHSSNNDTDSTTSSVSSSHHKERFELVRCSSGSHSGSAFPQEILTPPHSISPQGGKVSFVTKLLVKLKLKKMPSPPPTPHHPLEPSHFPVLPTSPEKATLHSPNHRKPQQRIQPILKHTSSYSARSESKQPDAVMNGDSNGNETGVGVDTAGVTVTIASPTLTSTPTHNTDPDTDADSEVVVGSPLQHNHTHTPNNNNSDHDQNKDEKDTLPSAVTFVPTTTATTTTTTEISTATVGNIDAHSPITTSPQIVSGLGEKRISFADLKGGELLQVHWVENFHYSDWKPKKKWLFF